MRKAHAMQAERACAHAHYASARKDNELQKACHRDVLARAGGL